MNIGVAALFNPLYEGDDQHGFSIVPDLRLHHGQEFFFSVAEGIGYKWNLFEYLDVGPIVRYKFTRRQHQSPNPFQVSGKTDDLEGMGDVKGAVEWGAFAILKLRPFEVRAETRKGRGGHTGEILQLSGSYAHRWGPVIGRFGPNIEVGSKAYIDPYFGVSPQQSANTGLSPYEAPGGLKSIGVSGLILLPQYYPYSLVAIAQYKRLQKAAADSPLVRERGSPDQWFLGLSLAYEI